MVPINIIEHPVLGLTVSGRELYRLIGNSRSAKDIFVDWFREKQRAIPMELGKDFIETKVAIPGRTRLSFEFLLTIAMAKKVGNAQFANQGAGVVAFLRDYERRLAEGITSELPQRVGESSLKTTLNLTSLNTPFPDLPKEELGRIESDPLPLGEVMQLPKPALQQSTALSANNAPPITPLQQALQQLQEAADKEAQAYDQRAEIARLTDQVQSLVRCSNTIANLFRQVATALLGELPVGELPIEANTDDDEGAFIVGSTSAVDLSNNGTRSKLIHLVNQYSEAKQVEQKKIWNFLYSQLSMVHHFSAKRHRSTNKEPYLDVVERFGHLDKLYNIANAKLLAPVAAPAQS